MPLSHSLLKLRIFQLYIIFAAAKKLTARTVVLFQTICNLGLKIAHYWKFLTPAKSGATDNPSHGLVNNHVGNLVGKQSWQEVDAYQSMEEEKRFCTLLKFFVKILQSTKEKARPSGM